MPGHININVHHLLPSPSAGLSVCLSPSVATFGAEATLLPAGEGSLSAFVAQYKLNLALAKEEERRTAEGAGKW